MGDLVNEYMIEESNDSSSEPENSSVTVAFDDQETIDQTVDSGLEGMVAPLMPPVPVELPVELPRINEADPNVAPAAPARRQRAVGGRLNRRPRRMRFLRDIHEQEPRVDLLVEPNEGGAGAEEAEMEPRAGGSNASRRGRRPRTTPIQNVPPVYLNLKRDEYHWFFPDSDDEE